MSATLTNCDSVATKSFAQIISNFDVVQKKPLPLPEVKGDSLCNKITQQKYENNVKDCQRKLHGRLIVSK